jgi:hypothetical protein
VPKNEVFSRVFALRHVERDKSNEKDPQTPTIGGETVAYIMGALIRKYYDPAIMEITSSPQPRATRTGQIVMAGIRGYTETYFPIETPDERLNDFSTDPRPEIVAGVTAGKSMAKAAGIEVESAMFIAGEFATNALDLKAHEALPVIMELGTQEAGHLVIMHGACIDQVFLDLSQELTGKDISVSEMGGTFDKVEGFVASFNEEGKLIALEQIRQPGYLKTLATVVK